MSTRPANYTKLTHEQISVLNKYYDEGMKSTTCLLQIQEAADEISQSVDKVKKWIGNKNLSLKKRQMQQVPSEELSVPPNKMPKPPSGIRGSSGYNLFCSNFFQSDEAKRTSSLAEKNKNASEKWNNLSQDEQQLWLDQATAKKNTSSELDTVTKEKLIEQHIKLIAKEFSYLEKLGCDSSCLLLNSKKEIFALGSSQGKNFLDNEVGMVYKFKSFFDVDDKVYTHEDVKLLFNTKYSEARGLVGARVPYLAGGFHVQGLPENVRLKKPRQYGSNEIKKIMAEKENIKFVIDEAESPSFANQDYKQSLMAIFQTNTFSDGQKISKEDVQSVQMDKLLNVFLVQDLMVNCEKLFMADALTDLKARLDELLTSTKGVILPIYCNEDEALFWLFYFPGYASDVLAKGPKDILDGYWLDHVPTNQCSYHLLNEKANVVGQNIIKDDLKKLLFVIHEFTEEDERFELHEKFSKNVVDVLSRQGFI